MYRKLCHFLLTLLLYINTIKYLKLKQVTNRLIRKIGQQTEKKEFSGLLPDKSPLWIICQLYDQKIDKDLNATFINKKVKLSFPIFWNDTKQDKLWLYNLHYFEYALAQSNSLKDETIIRIFDDWIHHNPVGHGNGWEPYPTSLRLVNLLKAWLGGLPLEKRHFKSLYEQANYLSTRLEFHLLGNHLLANLKALYFAGVIFSEPKWVERAKQRLILEISEQILDDGFHFELSPMYHSIITTDLLDLYNLSMSYPRVADKELQTLIHGKLVKMMDVIEYMYHGDHQPSFFNDSAFDIAPAKAIIIQYANKLSINTSVDLAKKNFVKDLCASGYYVAQINDTKLIFDVANVGADYIPGHAHADTLSFEMSCGFQRIFVNTGTSTYNQGNRRLFERKTKAHNTVVIDERDSSEVWGAFRVANRAKVLERHAQISDDYFITLSGAYVGANNKKTIHFRQISLDPDGLMIRDQITGPFKSAISRFYFHPSVKILENSNGLIFCVDNRRLDCDLANLSYRIVDSLWCPSFGCSIPNKCLEIDFETSNINLHFKWSL